ncbi:MAG: hypothetical protein ABH986_05600 [archaeon]
MSKFFNPSNLKKKGVKELSVLLLSREFPLQLIEIKKRLKEEFSVDVSFQAVKKAVDSLEEEGIIKKEGKSFFLDKKWISESKKFFDALTSRNVSKVGTRKGFNADYKKKNSFFFSDLYELDNFWADLMYEWINNIEKEEKKILTGQSPFGWWFLLNFASETKVHKELKKIGGKEFMVFTKDFPLNQLAVRSYKQIFPEGKYIIKENKSPQAEKDLSVLGDLIIEVEYPKDILRKLNAFFSKYRDFKTDSKDLQKLVTTKTKIKFTFFKDRFIAEKLRESVLQEFRKK